MSMCLQAHLLTLAERAFSVACIFNAICVLV